MLGDGRVETWATLTMLEIAVAFSVTRVLHCMAMDLWEPEAVSPQGLGVCIW